MQLQHLRVFRVGALYWSVTAIAALLLCISYSVLPPAFRHLLSDAPRLRSGSRCVVPEPDWLQDLGTNFASWTYGAGIRASLVLAVLRKTPNLEELEIVRSHGETQLGFQSHSQTITLCPF